MKALWPVVCVTSHRPQHLDKTSFRWIRSELHRIVVKLRQEHATQVAISGLALAGDQWWAESALAHGLELWAYIPYPQQADPWPEDRRQEWRSLLDRAAKVRVFGDLSTVAAAERNRAARRLPHVRNDAMLTDSSAAVAVWRPSKQDGGTASMVGKCRRRGLPIVHVNPEAVPPRTGLLVGGSG
jgi:hypothetical protein